MVKSSRSVDLEPIDRLEEKIRLLVATVDRMRSDQAKTTEENLRLSRELEALRSRMHASEDLANEMSALREERDVVRSRVSEMLEQLEALNL